MSWVEVEYEDESWVWQPGTITRVDGTKIDALIACKWREELERYDTVNSKKAYRSLDGSPLILENGDSALVEMPPDPDVLRQRKEAGDAWWDIESIGGLRGEWGPQVLNGSAYRVRLHSTQASICVIQVQLFVRDVSALQEAMGLPGTETTAVLDLLDEVSPDEIRRVLPTLSGAARDQPLILSRDAVERLMERARRRNDPAP